MEGNVYTYDPKLTVVTFKGVPIMGYASGTHIAVQRTNPVWHPPQVGAGGDITRVRSRDKSGTITLQLKWGSPTNEILSSFVRQGELFGHVGADMGIVMVKDLNGTTLHQAARAWIQGYPADNREADNQSNREWVIACANLMMRVGSSLAHI